jgi:hypothetical protein
MQGGKKQAFSHEAAETKVRNSFRGKMPATQRGPNLSKIRATSSLYPYLYG